MKKILFIAATVLLASCGGDKNSYDAAGTFEAVETIVSAEATGTIEQLSIEEGQQLTQGQEIGYIDTTQLYLKKKQLEAQMQAVLSKRPDIPAQLAALQVQLQQAEREQRRISNLVKADAATPKQLDDANAQVSFVKKQIEAQRSALQVTSTGISEETLPLEVQVKQVNDLLAKSRIVNPAAGVVLVKYAEQSEMATIGKPLYKIADVNTITLRAYITGDQLTKIKLGQQVTVLVDDGKDKYKEYKGTIGWISSKAEFTPKTIQTKDERANLVYATKITVKNDGYLKLGMYGEVKL